MKPKSKGKTMGQRKENEVRETEISNYVHKLAVRSSPRESQQIA